MTASDGVCGTEAHLLPQQGSVNINLSNTHPGQYAPNLKVLGRLIAMIAQQKFSL